MNTNLSQPQTRHFLPQVTKVMYLISGILFLWSFAASEAQGQKQEIIVNVGAPYGSCPSLDVRSVVHMWIGETKWDGGQTITVPYGTHNLKVLPQKGLNLVVEAIWYAENPPPDPEQKYTPKTPEASVSIAVSQPRLPGYRPQLRIALSCGVGDLMVSLDRPELNDQYIFIQGDDFPVSGRVTRNGQPVAKVTVEVNILSPALTEPPTEWSWIALNAVPVGPPIATQRLAIGMPVTLTTDVNGFFQWPGYFTADAKVGKWLLNVTAQIEKSKEKSLPAGGEFTVKQLVYNFEQVRQNMQTVMETWKNDPSIPNGMDDFELREELRLSPEPRLPPGIEVNYRSGRKPRFYREFGCSALTNKTLKFLNGLRFNPDKIKRRLLGHIDYGPILDGTGLIHVAVAIWATEPGSAKVLGRGAYGFVLEPWYSQTKEVWGLTKWRLTFVANTGMASNKFFGNHWKGGYPTTGSDGGYYPNPEHVAFSIAGKNRVAVLTYSPVEDLLTDSQGRRIGRLMNGTFVNEIPDGHQARALKEDGTYINLFEVPGDRYQVTITGTGNGYFHLKTASGEKIMSYGEQPIAAGQQATFTLNSADLRQPLMLADGRQVMPRPEGLATGEATASSGSAGGPVIPQGGAPLPGPVRPPSSSGIGGTWTTPTGEIIELIQNGNRITGRYRGILGEGQITGTFDGKNLSGMFRPNQSLIPLAVPFALTLLEDGKLVGLLETPLGSSPLSLTRARR